MVRIFKDDGTKIIGGIIASTIEQIKFLGPIGEEVLRKFNIKEINKEKFYPRIIRGNIHEIILDRYGEKTLYYLGVEQFNSIASESVFREAFKSKKYNLENFRTKSIEFKNKSIINQKRIIRKRFLDIITEIYAAKGAIIAKNDKISTSYKFISEDSVLLTITNAVFENHDEFNRGSLLNFFNKYIGDHWQIKAYFLKEKAEYRRGLSKNIFKFQFSIKKNIESLKLVHLQFRSDARDEFLKSILEKSEKQRILAMEQSKKIKKFSKEISKYIPAQIQEGLFKGNDTGIQTKRKKLTIFFSDIKNFTDTSEKLQPEDLTKYLNEYFSEMTKIALEYGATIDKYIGDAVMLFFGDPKSSGEREDARSCVEMSLKMQDRMIILREKWKNQGFYNPFQIRIGINTGYCNVGNFGSSQRLTYTIIGGEVNVAARLEAAAEADGILMSYETYAHVQDIIEVEEKPSVKMKGINREIKVFSVLSRKNKKNLFNAEINLVKGKKQKNIDSKDEIEKLKKMILIIKKDLKILTKKISDK